MNKYVLKKILGYSFAILFFVILIYNLLIPLGFFDNKKTKFGNLVWKFDAQSAVVGSPIFDGNNVYIQTETDVLALKSSTGTMIWKTSVLRSSGDTDRHFLQIKDKILMVFRKESPALALSAETGDILWGNQPIDRDVIDVSVYEDILYEARYSSFLTSYAIYSGNINWSSNVPSRTSLYIFPEKDVVYLGTSSGLLAFDAAKGQVMWEYDLKGLAGGMAKVNNILYLAFIKGECSFAAFDIQSLSYLWCIPKDNVSALSVINNVLVENNVVYVSGNKLVAVSSDSGNLIWQSETRDNFGPPVLSNNQMYTQGQSRIYEISLTTGKGESMFSYPNMYIISWMSRSNIAPVIINDLILITIKNNLYAYKLNK